jgi:hypothetical protein
MGRCCFGENKIKGKRNRGTEKEKEERGNIKAIPKLKE